MKCLILAAGKGSRLSDRGSSKPLIPLLGVPLIERTIRSLLEAGASSFYVVSGYHAEQVRRFLDDLASALGTRVTHVDNPAWQRGNGVSVLAARSHLDEPFLLLMADHLFDPSIPRDLIQRPPDAGEITLAVDLNVSNPSIDMDDVTRIACGGGKIEQVGKGLDRFDGFDTGIFCATPALFAAIDRSIATHDDDTLSGGVRQLAAQGRANAFDIGGRFWLDVDSPDMMDQGEKAMLDGLRGKPTDGPVSRYLNRPLSIRLSSRLAKLPITPNQISIFSFLCCVVAAGLFATSSYLTRQWTAYVCLAIGGILAQFGSIIDGCDGEIARLKFLKSDFGGWFDAVLDRYADSLLLLGMTWRVFVSGDPLLNVLAKPGTDHFQAAALLVGFLAMIGSFMVSYTADKYDHLMRERFTSGTNFRIGRDVRIVLIFIAAVSTQLFLVLLFHAVWMNVEVVRRVWVCRR